MTSRSAFVGLSFWILLGGQLCSLFGQAPAQPSWSLTDQIDRLVTQSTGVSEWTLASDATLIRRVTLDLVGETPATSEVRAFIVDASPEKYVQLVDRLLSDPRHSRRMADWLDLTLMERRAKVHIDLTEWKTYLENAFQDQRTLDSIVREILMADGSDELGRPAARFYLARSVEPNLLTRDIGRFLFGRDLQCAQCHNHPHIEDYNQSDYYGIFAFVNRSSLFTDKDKKAFVADKADGEVEFTSVFTGDEGRTGPQLPDGARLIEPIIPPDQLYTTPPADGVRPIPNFSRRKWLAEHATDGDNAAFNKNWANRLWALMFGRGLVHPLDLHHRDNPPTHPELLETLGSSLSKYNFDTRRFLREVALSRAYRRAFSSELPAWMTQSELDLPQQIETLSAQKDQLVSELEGAKKSQLETLTAWRETRNALDTTIDAWIVAKTDGVKLESNQRVWSTELQNLTEQANLLEHRRELLQKAIAGLENASETLEPTSFLPTQKIFRTRIEALKPDLDKSQKRIEELKTQLSPTADLIRNSREKTEQLQSLKHQQESIEADLKKTWASHQNQFDQKSYRIAQLNKAIKLLATGRNLMDSQREWTEHQQQLGQQRIQLEETAQRLEETRQFVLETSRKLTLGEKKRAQLMGQRNQLQTNLSQGKRIQNELASALTAVDSIPDPSESSKLISIRESLVQQVIRRKQASLLIESELAQTSQAFRRTESTQVALKSSMTKWTTLLSELESVQQMAQQQMTELEKRTISLASNTDALRSAWVETAEAGLIASGLTPLTPEQLAWSLMQVTGVIDNQIQAQLNQLDKDEPLTDAQKSQPDLLTERKVRAAALARAKLQSSVNVFVSLFGHGAGQPQDGFFATVDQSLFFANAGTVRGWIAQGGNSLYQRLRKIEEPEAFAEELFLSVFCRPPSQDELALVDEYLSQEGTNRSTATQDLIWALVTSSEFRFNH